MNDTFHIIKLVYGIKENFLCHVVLGKSCSQAKHTAAHALPGQKMPMASFA